MFYKNLSMVLDSKTESNRHQLIILDITTTSYSNTPPNKTTSPPT